MKRKRDIQGKFTLKDQDYRQVHSLRLTDATWKAWGIAAERLDLSRADLLENLVKQNQGHFPDIYPQKPILKTNITLNQDELTLFCQTPNQLSKNRNNYPVGKYNLEP